MFVDYLKTRVPHTTVCPVVNFAPAKNVKGTFLLGQLDGDMEDDKNREVGVATAVTEAEADATTTPQPRRQQLPQRVAFHRPLQQDRATIHPIATSGTTT